MKKIKLTKDKFAIVDDEDFEYLNQWKWLFDRYASRQEGNYEKGTRKMIYMHRLIMKTPDGFDTDHINGNKLDNRKENLRIVTRQLNNANARIAKNNKLKFKGIWFSKRLNKYTASIGFNYKIIHLGCFTSAIEAAKAYDAKAKELFGEFAYLNFQ